jgi:sugar lactone lactonase YvrE/tetratricopeptide (TPR) repeat protein
MANLINKTLINHGVKTMRIFSIALLGMLSIGVASAQNNAALPKILKADFVKEIAVGDTSKLLGSTAEGLYWHKNDGVVVITDKEGKLLRTLSTKEGKDPILKQPEMVAAGEGIAYIIDREMEQVVAFSSAGKYLYSFNSKSGGFFSSGGDEISELKSPRGIAYRDGIVYVSDTGNKRIQMFGANGVFLQSLALKPGVVEKNEANREQYKLREPTDIAVDYLGRVYVLDADDGLVKIYAPKGDYLGALAGTKFAQSMSAAADGIYVAERDTLTVRKYGFSTKMLFQFGSKGEGKGQFKSITGMAVTPDHQFFIGDSKKGMASVYLADVGETSDAIPKLPSMPYAEWRNIVPSVTSDKLAWNGKDTLYSLDKDNKSILRIRPGQADTLPQKDLVPVAIAVDRSSALWVLDKKKYRVVKLNDAGQIVSSMGSEGRGAGQFDEPADLAISSNGTIYVADPGNRAVVAYNSDGVFQKALKGNSAHAMDEPIAMTIDAQDNLYVLDKSRFAIVVFSPQGELLTSFGKAANGDVSGLIKPVALSAVADEIHVVDGNRVKVYTRQGNYLRAYAAKGKGNGELDKPVAIASVDSANIVIAEQGNKRIQSFLIQHKPIAPSQFKATGTVHAVELSWNASPQSYIKQYNIYRSKTENGGYERVASSTTNQYVVQGLEPDATYYFRIGAETKSGVEGATSQVTSAVSQKFMPKPLEFTQAEATPWQIKMSWKPAEIDYFASYQVYQKDGDNFVKIGETIKPEFNKDGLTPDTKYVYYVSVKSTDATESDKVAISAQTLTFNRPPLEIDVVTMRNIFSNTYKLYEQDGIGLIKLTNNTNKPIEQIKLLFTIKNFMDFPVEEKIAVLMPGQSQEIRLKSVFNNSILTVTEDTSVQASVEASYFENGSRVAFNKSSTLTVYEKHRLVWDEHGRFASFITPKDEPIMAFVRAVIAQYKETKDEALLSAAVFNAMGAIGMTYIQNPNDPYQIVKGNTNVVDYIQFPRETLERKSGDCVDLVAFYITALESMGVSARAIEVPGHMLMMFSTGVSAPADGYTMDDLYIQHEGKLWIPVEATMVGKSFVKAWEEGSKVYHQWAGKDLTVLNVEDEWKTYKPATLPDVPLKWINVTRDEVEKMFPNEFLSMLKISLQTKVRGYLQVIAKDPNDVDSLLQVGIIMAKNGDPKEGMQYFDKVIAIDPKNASAFNNRGNLFMIQDKFRDAQKAYASAAQYAPDDAEVWVNLARSYKATTETKKAKEAISKAQTIDPSVKKRYKTLSLELMSAM